MGIRIHRTVFDDLDGGTDNVGTHQFALDDTTYEIDLSDTNLDRLRAALAPYIAAGRRLAKTKTGTARRAAERADRMRIRQWWAENPHGLDLPAHRATGPIPDEVRAAYQAHP